jgi:2-amino-4-hydroxy-6-hydroxymethyldihydropteridine diphosphokinase
MIAWLGLGGNLGDPERAFVLALAALEQQGDRVLAVASLWQTAAIGPGSQPDHLNTVVRLATDTGPRELLMRLKEQERAAGRVPGEPWGPRPLDMDLLLLSDNQGLWLQVEQPGLRVPHPRIGERAFVLCPLLELEPGLEDAREGLPWSRQLQQPALRAQRVSKVIRKEPWYPVRFVQ